MALSTPFPRELLSARELTDQIFGMVRADSWYERPIPERHRLLFYLGHLEAFDWNLLARYALDLPSFDTGFDRLFAFGIDPGEGNLPNDQPSDWPQVAEVERYNRLARERIDAALPEVPAPMVEAAIEHRLMHAETLAYLLHQLPYERKTAGPGPAVVSARAPEPSWVAVPAGSAQLGLCRGAGFGWDNEYEAHEVSVPGFSISRYKVTNGEYLKFVEAGAEAPFFWARRQDAWFYRGMFAERPLPLDWPVYVTKLQADAYADWRGAVLPTEAQFHRAADGLPPSANTGFRFWDPTPVTADDSAAGARASAPAQMTGNGWEWTSSAFGPFAGFEPYPFYSNYSEPFFDGEHFVLKGGSPCTPDRLLRPSFRNWFRPSYPYVYATFRLVQS